jgi:hypothetical protein
MRVLLIVTFPHEPFNSYVRDGSAAQRMGKILAALKPESAYFVEIDGHRTGVLAVNLKSESAIPSLAEPFFLQFQAICRFHPAMSVNDLKKADLAALGKKWG